MTVLPPFLPNEYLLKHHRDKVREGAADWEIFAWAVRDVMAKVGVFETIEVDVRDKPLYKNYMRCKTDKLEYKG